MLGQLINLNIFAFLLVFARIGTAFSLLPGFGSQQVPMYARLGFALAVSLLVTPILMNLLPAQPHAVSALFLLLASEILIGAFLGMIPRVLMGALQTAGTMISMMASMSNMFIQDPIADQQSSVISTFLTITALTLVFVTNTHYVMLQAVVDSYNVFKPTDSILAGDMGYFFARQVSDSFRIGIQITSPFIVAGLAYYLGLGIMGRLMPQLPVFFFGLPIQITMQLFLFIVALTSIMLVFMSFFENGILALSTAVGM